MAKLALAERPAAVEIPELRAAFRAESDAVATIHDIKGRLVHAEAALIKRREEHEGLSGRAARGAEITAADIRRSIEAVADAEATIVLLREALPKAADVAVKAAHARSEAVARHTRRATQPLQDALAATAASLRLAQAALIARWPTRRTFPRRCSRRLSRHSTRTVGT